MKLIKNKCEIDDCLEIEECALHFHHIIERTMVETCNKSYNIAILCSNHHNMVHANIIEIIGVFPSTKLPNKRILVYKTNGIINIEGLEKPLIIPKLKSYKIYNKEREKYAK